MAILIAISTISPVAMNIYMPSMSGMVETFDTTSGRVQLTMSLYFLSIGIAQLVLGPLSDRLGRRPVILGGMVMFVAGTILCLMAPTVEALIAARVLQAAGGATGLVLGRAIVRDLYGRDQAASMIGYVTMGMSVGPMVAPAIGGLLDEQFGWSGGFYLVLVLGVVVTFAAVFALPETHHNRTAGGGVSGIVTSYKAIGAERLFWGYALVSMFTSAIYFAILGGTPFIAAGVLDMTPPEIGFYFFFIAIGYMAGNFLSGRFAARIGIYRMILIGSVFPALGVGALVLFLATGLLTPLTFFGPMVLIGLGNGLCLPSTISGAVSVRPDLAGAASGLSGSLQIGFGAVASAAVAWALSDTMYPDTVWPMAAVMVACVIATTVFVVAVRLWEK
ncbi:Bcr/CflA family drug resistance efflux transporter [Roseibium aquae]|uniref:Bcr/CflA family efflux transporter n=1 Tax=Roseibium aquae TaxID=1323746 RepID=A0A916WYD3_9HYPH|nr:Bcr/CflA family drug resistance efflux transporter [Roseibium aquae]